MKPLYGYDSMENSYLVPDYPYGGMRCQIRFWLESDKKKGFRFFSQTQNPKNMRWNNPKKSTYCLLAGCMYLDEKGHVFWSGLTEYSSAENVLEYIKKFPNADTKKLHAWCAMKVKYVQARVDGKAVWTINGVPQHDSEAEKERLNVELDTWKKCVEVLKNQS